MTVEWIHGDECRDLKDMLRFMWLSEGSVLLYDTGVPKEGALQRGLTSGLLSV